MDALVIIALLDGLIGLAVRISDEFKPQNDTPEEQVRILESLKTSLASTAAQIAAWKPANSQS